ncbi:MAG: DUF481 domain-containing protein [Gammaproteobacteria bacterium]|nr:DUF481 domain-containing protein [Gammaproteobacteria bacterium]
MRLSALLLGGLLAAGGAAASGAADDSWAARAQAGFAKTTGNTDTTTANLLFHAAHVVGQWKYLVGLEGLYGATKGETTAQAWSAHLQANYNLTERLYTYGGLRDDDDRFSGFAYQQTLSAGAGYQLVKSDATKLTGQVGAGVRRLRPEILLKDQIGGVTSRTELAATTDAVLDAAVNYEHAFNDATKVLAAASVESGRANTLTKASAGLQVKMTSVLALAAAVQLVRNSNPPLGAKNTDTLSTLSLVYEFKNPQLAPE